MVTVLKSEGGTQILSANLQKTIQSIKEIVGNHSDTEIYNALKESNMDPNETAQKLLNQDPFHEVRRKRDKKKESAGYKGYRDMRKRAENVGQAAKFYAFDRNVRRASYARNVDAGISCEFRVVKDNRVNQNSDKEAKPASVQGASINDRIVGNIYQKSTMGASSYQKQFGGGYTVNGMNDSRHKLAEELNSNGTRKEYMGRKSATSSTFSQVPTIKPTDSQSSAADVGTNNSIVGVYASASDPVHVPSLDSRSPAAIGAIKRDVGVVGVRRQSLENTFKQSSRPSSSNSNAVLGSSSGMEGFRPIASASKNDQLGHVTVSDSLILGSSSRTFLSNHHGGKPHQQPIGHQKGTLPSKEWKPKSSQKSNATNPGVIGTPVKSVLPAADDSNTLETEASKLQDKLSQVNIHETGNVIIAQHIRVPENDRCQLTFGSFGPDLDTSVNSVSGPQVVGSIEESVGPLRTGKQINSLDDQGRSSGSSTPSGATSENQLPDKRDSGSGSSENYDDMGLVHENGTIRTASEPQQHQDPPELPSFSAYDPQAGYDVPYFRPSIDDAVSGQGLPSPREALTSHTVNTIPASSIAMMQQQAPVTQMYPQVHVSHFANVMPYRQFLSPVYVPPMGLPGYSSNGAYPHPPNGSSYLLMPVGGSHLAANSLKYGVQQFKPVPAGSPTGFGSFSSPTGYAMNTPGGVGGAAGLDDSSRIKYKDGNLYVPNPQTEASEVWIPNPRELSGMQSTPYYNIQGQTAHPAYLQSHTGHASFNAAAAAVAAQSSHMQFPGLYHPPQPSAIPSGHHLAAPMGGNAGVGVAPAAPGAQVGAYQQPQLGHLNWTTNF
ncbi:hypothetical protein Ancab_012583 [Ancistrocladus abbreviatus]